tara:strand:- start:2348 stop:3490 length:1143 start_codon:yes stop_codon:yes gene_type:complete
MGLAALKGKKSKKKIARSRARTGVNGAPIEKGFDAVKDYFHMNVDKKDCIDQVKTWVKKNFPEPSKYILANPDYKFCMTHHAATAFWYNAELNKTQESEKAASYLSHLFERIIPLIEEGKALYNAKKLESDNSNVITLSPQQRLQQKISNTIMQDLLSLEDSWIEGEQASLDVYQMFGKHGLSGSATIPVRTVIEGWLLDYEDAYHKRCEQAVEGYSHLKRSELNRRIKECQSMLADLDRIKAAKKATRSIKIPKLPSIDKQVSRIKYQKEDSEFKIVSINPAQIVGKVRLFVFNTKYKELSYYQTDHPKGFQISGSTIKNFNRETSVKIKLRKPMDFIPILSNKTANQIQKELDGLSTKGKEANGRINKDTILLRVFDK